jgi:hypothetical protein
MAKRLLVLAGPDEGREFTFKAGDTVLLGRSRATNTLLIDPHVSRVHCEIQAEEGLVFIADNDSVGGTYVNGKRVESQQILKPGDIIRIGITRLQYFDDEVGETGAAQARAARAGAGDDDAAATIPPGQATAPRPSPRAVPAAKAGHGAKVATKAAQASPGARPAAKAAPAAAPRLGPGVKWQDSLVGQKLSNYKVGPVLAKGKCGYVFHGRDTRKNLPVAIKVLEPTFSKTESAVQRFVRAMKTVLPLRHPNLVRVYAAGKTGPYCWIAMEYVQGESLAAVIARIETSGMLDWRHVLRFAVYIARALDYAHSRKIVHRNVTPTNIILGSNPQDTKLSDLMLAKALEGDQAQQITRKGEVLGDLPYLAPERTMGTSEETDGRCDIYSLGATIYAMLTGHPPFSGETVTELVTQIRRAEPPTLKSLFLGVPEEFEAIVAKMMAKNPAARHASSKELLQELERLAQGMGVAV